ncbi:MAG: hydroxymethylbilane synthase [Polyangiaceae bacterium]
MSDSAPLKVATRKSLLALAQSRAWMAALKAKTGIEVEEVQVTTTGDRVQDRQLIEIGGKGLFIKEIEEAMLAGEADAAVHSMKDVPAALAPGLVIACVPLREDPRDVIHTRTGCSFAELPSGSKVGTGSLRRSVQLKALRPDLEFVPIRGNIDTRLRRVTEGVVDAVVLAYAGLRRIGRGEAATQVFSTAECLPAVGQGALAIEIRQSDARSTALVRALDDVETALMTAAERGVLEAVEGNCQIPVAAYAERQGDELLLRALLAEPDGSRLRRREERVAWPATNAAARTLGYRLGQALRIQP